EFRRVLFRSGPPRPAAALRRVRLVGVAGRAPRPVRSRRPPRAVPLGAAPAARLAAPAARPRGGDARERGRLAPPGYAGRGPPPGTRPPARRPPPPGVPQAGRVPHAAGRTGTAPPGPPRGRPRPASPSTTAWSSAACTSP